MAQQQELQRKLDAEVANNERPLPEGFVPSKIGGGVKPEVSAPGPHQSVGTNQAATFKMPSPEGTKDVNMTTVSDGRDINKQLTEDSRRTKEALWKMPLITFVVPLDIGEKAGVAEEFVSINDYKLRIKKGVVVQLPQPIVTMLMEHYNINNGGVAMDKRLDRDETVHQALT